MKMKRKFKFCKIKFKKNFKYVKKHFKEINWSCKLPPKKESSTPQIETKNV